MAFASLDICKLLDQVKQAYKEQVYELETQLHILETKLDTNPISTPQVIRQSQTPTASTSTSPARSPPSTYGIDNVKAVDEEQHRDNGYSDCSPRNRDSGNTSYSTKQTDRSVTFSAKLDFAGESVDDLDKVSECFHVNAREEEKRSPKPRKTPRVSHAGPKIDVHSNGDACAGDEDLPETCDSDLRNECRPKCTPHARDKPGKGSVTSIVERSSYNTMPGTPAPHQAKGKPVIKELSSSVSRVESYLSLRSATRTQNLRTSYQGPEKNSNQERASALNRAIARDDGGLDIFEGIVQPIPKQLGIARGDSGVDNSYQGQVRRMLVSTRYNLFIAFAIISYIGFMGYQIDWSSRHVGSEIPVWQAVVGRCYTVVFFCELSLRMFDERLKFWLVSNPVWYWNYLDFVIVTISLVEFIFESMIDIGQFNFFRLIRISRLIKILRIGRLVRFVRALRRLVYSILHTLKSVFWALLLLLIIIYVFAMILTQATASYQEESKCQPDDPQPLCDFWGHLAVSMLSLLKAVAGGISWHEILEPMAKKLDAIWVLVFLAYILFVYFAVLNVITGVFCESAIQSAKLDEELVIHETVIKRNNYIRKLSLLFDQIDTDDSHEISMVELEQFMEQELAGAFFEYLELEVGCAADVARLLDTDQSGKLSRDEFINGIWRLRGPATAYALASLTQEFRALQDDVWRILNDISSSLRDIYMLSGKTP